MRIHQDSLIPMEVASYGIRAVLISSGHGEGVIGYGSSPGNLIHPVCPALLLELLNLLVTEDLAADKPVAVLSIVGRAEHFYVVTENLPEPPGSLPVLRDPDHAIYIKEDAGKFLVGMFEPVAKPWGMGGIPEDCSFEQLPADWDHVMPQLEAAAARVPAFAEAGVQLFFNGPESFTPDDRYLSE
jgi:hypothetical protein